MRNDVFVEELLAEVLLKLPLVVNYVEQGSMCVSAALK